MKKMIERINQKPLEDRRRIGMSVVVIVTVIIFFAWLGTLSTKLTKTSDNTKTESPFGIIKGTVVELYGNASEGLSSMKK